MESNAKKILAVPISAIRREARKLRTVHAEQKVVDVEVLFDGKAYYRRENDNDFHSLGREDIRLYLRSLGLSERAEDGQLLSPAEKALLHIQQENRVTYAAPFCGRAAGIYRGNGISILATNSPVIP